MITTTIRSVPAIIGGTIAAGIAWATIVRDVGFLNIGLDHIQAAALVGLTVLAGHLAAQAWKQGHLLAPAALVMLATIGSALTVYSAMGNRAEVRDTKVATASMSEAVRERIESDLATTTKLVEQAIKWQANSCGRDRTSDSCKGHTFLLRQREASQKALQAQLLETGPIVTPEPKAAQVALLAGLAGYDGDKAKRFVSAIDPLVTPLFFELLAILMFSFGLGHKSASATSVIEAANDAEPLPPKQEPVPLRLVPTESEVIKWRTEFAKVNGRLPRGKELQAAFDGIPKTSAWRYANCKSTPRDESKIRRIASA